MAIEKSRIKFAKSPETGEVIGFVSRNSKTKQLRGVPETSTYGKKICVLSEDLKGGIEPNILYDVELKPMHLGNGYVVVSARRTLFEAKFETVVIPKAIYQLKITFGHKTIFFDPKDGKSASSRTIKGVSKVIDERDDILDKEGVKARFCEDAKMLLQLMEKDGYVMGHQLELFEECDQ